MFTEINAPTDATLRYQPHIYNVSFNIDGTESLYVDGQHVTTDERLSQYDYVQRIIVGGTAFSNLTQPRIYINEIILVNDDLRNTPTQKSIHEYLSSKWNIPLVNNRILEPV